MAKRSRKKNYKKTLAYDLGGTKIAVAVVDERGRILEEKREPVDIGEGPRSLINQLVRLGTPLVKEHKLKFGAIASAGPLDPIKGVLLNPTNFKTSGRHWGVVPLIAAVRKKLRIDLRLENDAAAAAIAEHWIGRGRGVDNIVVVTLGTGVGVGIVANGQLVRSGRHLHTEGGHLIIDYNNHAWQCGCGNFGCAEAFLSGMNFTKNMARIWSEPGLTAHDLVTRGQRGEEKVLKAFGEYGERLAVLLYSLCVLFSPQKIILAGGFSHSADLFLNSCEARLRELMRERRAGIDLLPAILVSRFQEEAGLLGAAAVSFTSNALRKRS